VSRPRLLDLFCGAGGAAVGYHRAGFDVVGVDIAPQPHYPFEFHQEDALTVLDDLALGYTGWAPFDAVHASPPCQAYSAMRGPAGSVAPDLIATVRSGLSAWRRASGLPYVIENVERSPLRNAVTLCGTMFDLPIRRHRLFELAPVTAALIPSCTCRNGVRDGRLVGQMLSGKVLPGRTPRHGYTESQRRTAIGVPWMTTMEARQAIPPAYTEFIGSQLLRARPC
jgi:DNA (cytosine-5)-methyltransferase 1